MSTYESLRIESLRRGESIEAERLMAGGTPWRRGAAGDKEQRRGLAAIAWDPSESPARRALAARILRELPSRAE